MRSGRQFHAIRVQRRTRNGKLSILRSVFTCRSSHCQRGRSFDENRLGKIPREEYRLAIKGGACAPGISRSRIEPSPRGWHNKRVLIAITFVPPRCHSFLFRLCRLRPSAYFPRVRPVVFRAELTVSCRSSPRRREWISKSLRCDQRGHHCSWQWLFKIRNPPSSTRH